MPTPQSAPAIRQDVTAALAEFAMAIRFEHLPADVVEVAKHCLLDWLGVTIAGRDEPLVRMLLDQAVADGGAPQATVVGMATKVNAGQAALINGSASHALDYDDVQERLHGHPTAPIAPVLLALAEKDGRSGRDLIAAFVAGVEVECRVNQFMGEGHYERGWHSTATNGTFGAAVAAGHLLGFSAEQCAVAMGIAGTQAAGLRAMFGTMCKPMHAGKAAQNGLFAAQMAARGLTSRPDVLERPLGFGATQSDGPSAERALAGLGERYEVSDVLFKYHAACHGVHASVEALQDIRRSTGLAAADVESVEVAVQNEYLNICGIDRPETGLEGKFSLKFCSALALAGADTADPETYSDRAVADPPLVDLLDRVSIVARPEMEMKTSDVVVHLKSGVVHRGSWDAGIPDTDLARQHAKLAAKFHTCADPVIGAEQAGKLIAEVDALDRAQTIAPLVQAWR
ncbi:MAG: MmgE/PrpD family protein [Alphaproteobacteria bacterium]|nr:MmgE/PrpD family protein [Alphaproteobacteria bacterium]MCB9929578.1 MmgE/PrpD family protein [Alphaproteobacteria bacterium]